MTPFRSKTGVKLSGRQWFFVGLLLLLAPGCTTTTPFQTASTVTPGVWRVGAQGAVSPACSIVDPLGFFRVLGSTGRSPFERCMVSPRGIPTPELRAHARRGLSENMDLGFSLHGSTVLPVGLQVGGTGDIRREVWSRPLGENRRQLLTLGPQLGLALIQFTSSGTSNIAPELQSELVLPVYFGHQLEKVELVASPRFVERFNLVRNRSGTGTTLLDAGYLGLSLAALTRTPLQFAVGLDYFAPTGQLEGGLFTVTLGLAYDVGG